MTDDRAVSEVIGFVLVFSLILASVSIVYVFGFTGLQQARDAEQLNNAERAFEVLADNVNDIHYDDAPNRATEFRLYDAQLAVGEPTTFNVTVTDLNPKESYSVDGHPVVYRPNHGPTTLRYVNGGILREDRNGAIFVSEPSFVFRESGGERTAVIPLIETRPRRTSPISGTTTVLVRTALSRAELLADLRHEGIDTTDADDRYAVTFRIVSPSELRASAWKRYVESELDAAYGAGNYCTRTDSEVVCEFQAEQVQVSATRIDTRIGS